jgi:hypothetical protein
MLPFVELPLLPGAKLGDSYCGRYSRCARCRSPSFVTKWKSPTSGEEVLSCTILTCEPNNAMGELHDRVPVILEENDWPKWLGEEPANEQELLAAGTRH